MRTICALKISVAIEKVPVMLASNLLIKTDRCTQLSLRPQLRSCHSTPRISEISSGPLQSD
jgi:hypothetical protein